MTPSAITPYLMFGGRCEEALAFYTAALGAEVDMVMRFNESPDPTPEGMLPPGFETKVMHAAFRAYGTTIYASDGIIHATKFDGFSLALSVPTEAEAERAFDALADGGTVTMPLTKTFWSPKYGMLADRFGVEWMVMVPGEMPPK